MGEITEALRRARQESQGLDTAPPEPGPEPVAPRRLRPEPSAKRDDAVEISREHSGTWPARVVVIDERGAASEYYRHFALRVLRAMKERRARSVLVTSALREEGKTTTACNLACSTCVRRAWDEPEGFVA